MLKRRIFSVILFVCFIFQSLSLTSCGENLQKYSEYSFDLFDTVTSITGYEKTQDDFDKVSAQILDELAEYHRLFDIYKRYEGMENLCTVNELKDGEHRTVTVDKRIIDMLIYAKEMYYKTDGNVNIAMGSVLSIWHDYRTHGIEEPWAAELPPMEKLIAASEHTDIEKMVIDEAAGTVTLTDPQMKLDVGAIAKGYAVEMAARTLEEKGITGYVINVGGNIRTIGAKGNGEKWLAGIENPEGDEEKPYIEYLNLSGEALVTSGSYQRYYTVGDKRYHHIIDPETLMPSDRFLSVSVVCQSSADGDALSTALFCMTYEEGLDLIESLSGIEAMWQTTEGEVLFSSGFLNYTN
ncbi:MAG: FAD:protein FMN transferase [Clostridia bacterium]|nr:FAD:protein FMN transferase [Clostridia bacterium]